jgi:TPR repeat protein
MFPQDSRETALTMNFRHPLVCFVLLCAIAACVHLPPAAAQTQNIATLHKQAKEGNAEAQYELAKAYYTGTGVPKDSKQGLEWLRKSANQGHSGAEFALAILYRKGELKDPKQGLEWLTKSAGHGNSAAEYELALVYLKGEQNIARDPKQALEWLRKSASQNNAASQYQLGCMFRDGQDGVSRNPHEAALWFRKAARQQNDAAQSDLTQMLKKGVISKQEANWKAPEPLTKAPEPVTQAKTEKSKPFSLVEVEKGLQGGITCKRMASLVDKFKVDFSLNDDMRQRLGKEGADDNLLATISASKRPL